MNVLFGINIGKIKIKLWVSHVGLLDHLEFYPAVFGVIQFCLSLPSTTRVIKRTFSTLEFSPSVSSMSEDLQNGSCTMSVHRERIHLNETTFIENAIDTYRIKRRNVQFLFSGVTKPNNNFYYIWVCKTLYRSQKIYSSILYHIEKIRDTIRYWLWNPPL